MARWKLRRVGPWEELFGDIARGWKAGLEAGKKPGMIESAYRPSSISARRTHGLFTSAEQAEVKAMQDLYERARTTYEASPLASHETSDIVVTLVKEAVSRAGEAPATPILVAFCEATQELMSADALEPITVDWSLVDANHPNWLDLRIYLTRHLTFFSNYERSFDIWSEKLVRTYEGMFSYFPPDDTEEDLSDGEFTVALIDLLHDPAEVIERLLSTFFDDDVTNSRLFENLRNRFDRNVIRASGFDPDRPDVPPHRLALPTQQRSMSPTQLVQAYLNGTPFEALFQTQVPFQIPKQTRFEHMHIVGGTGHGKTQLLQYLIADDLERALEEERSVIVIDGQGDLIRNIAHLDCFDPNRPGNISDKLILIDPTDIEYPIALNMFDANLERIAAYPLLEQEKILNGTVELYEYLFGALLGAELTQKQDVLFRYLARLMLVIPDATIHTLMGLIDDPRHYLRHVEELGGMAQTFFEREFLHPSFAATKRQIGRRLWGVLATPALERMFSHPRNKIDFFSAMNSGKVILINTAKDLLKQQGCEVFGRFFIAMIAQAAMQRSAISESDRVPCHVYIDEAHDYFDDSIEHILNQARKYRVAIHLAHQNLDQLSGRLRASVMASTSIKLAGGVSSKDAHDFAREMRCDASFVQGMRKHRESSEFACFIKNRTARAVKLSVPIGFMEGLDVMGEGDFDALLSKNRVRYCSTRAAVEVAISRLKGESVPDAEPKAKPQPEPTRKTAERPHPPIKTEQPRPEPLPDVIELPEELVAVPQEGRGGRQHKYLQQLVKQLGDERNFRSVIEHEIPVGGRVDVSLQNEEHRIAVEISISTSPEHERENVRKCLDGEFDQVIVLCAQAKQKRTMQAALSDDFAHALGSRVFFYLPDEFIAHLDQLAAQSVSNETAMRGYRVKVTHKAIDEEDAKARRQAIAKIIMRSLGTMLQSP